MSISYKSDSMAVVQPKPPLMLFLMLVNALFSLALLSAWTHLAGYVAEPVAWATWARIYRTGEVTDIFEYPFSMLWMMPMIFVGFAWSAEKLGSRSLAWVCCLTPVLINGMVMGWFHFAPIEWR